tara:strand:+ start:4979 stop:6199 length:1221 start_codon:yes stop_codon:yes gene_type:complete
MHLEELEKLENEYNISLSEQDKFYMIVNKYTLVIHKDETYTLIKGHKIKDSCLGFKYVGVHSIEGKKKVDLNDYSLLEVNLLGSVYGYNACDTTITPEPGEYIVNANVNDNNNVSFVATNNDISYINTTLEKDSIELLKHIDYKSSFDNLGGVWPGLAGMNFGINSIIQPVLWKGDNIATETADLVPNYIWIYDSSLDKNIKSKAWTSNNEQEYYDRDNLVDMNLHLVDKSTNEWTIYNSLINKDEYKNEIVHTDSWFVNSQYIVDTDKFFDDGSPANFVILSKDIIKIPTDCSKIIFEMYRYPTKIEIKATVVHTSATGPQPSSNLTIKQFYTPNCCYSPSGPPDKFHTTPFTSQTAFKTFNYITPFAVESPVAIKFNHLKIKIRASGSIMPINTSPNNTICKIP